LDRAIRGVDSSREQGLGDVAPESVSFWVSGGWLHRKEYIMIVNERVRREKALDFSGCNSRPGTGSLHPVAIEAAAEATKPSELFVYKIQLLVRDRLQGLATRIDCSVAEA
jgi:hypothetical protein